MDHWDTITAERLRLADELEGLGAADWSTPSLCAAWTVRDVAGHLVAPLTTLALPKFLLAFAVARGNFERANVHMTGWESRRSTDALTADLRRHAASHFKPPGFGSEAPLTDVLVHGADIRIPLGRADDGAPERWRPVLDLVTSSRASRGFVPRPLPAVRFAATDVEWSAGSGDVVEGPADALALSILGRPARLDALSGPGAATFSAWVMGA